MVLSCSNAASVFRYYLQQDLHTYKGKLENLIFKKCDTTYIIVNMLNLQKYNTEAEGRHC